MAWSNAAHLKQDKFCHGRPPNYVYNRSWRDARSALCGAASEHRRQSVSQPHHYSKQATNLQITLPPNRHTMTMVM